VRPCTRTRTGRLSRAILSAKAAARAPRPSAPAHIPFPGLRDVVRAGAWFRPRASPGPESVRPFLWYKEAARGSN
jgi:hypothetical protein